MAMIMEGLLLHSLIGLQRQLAWYNGDSYGQVPAYVNLTQSLDCQSWSSIAHHPVRFLQISQPHPSYLLFRHPSRSKNRLCYQNGHIKADRSAKLTQMMSYRSLKYLGTS
jgi:hypothetical protein